MLGMINHINPYKKMKQNNKKQQDINSNSIKNGINLKNNVNNPQSKTNNNNNMDIDDNNELQNIQNETKIINNNNNNNKPPKSHTSRLMKNNPVDDLGFSLYPKNLDNKTIDYTKWLTETMKESNLCSYKLVLGCMLDDWYLRYDKVPLHDKDQKNEQIIKLMGFVYPYIRYVIKSCEHDVEYYDIFVKYMINLHYYLINQVKYDSLNITSEIAAGIAFNVCVTYNLTDSNRFWSPAWNKANIERYNYHCFDTAWINASLLVACGSYSLCEDHGFIRKSDTSSLEPALDKNNDKHKSKSKSKHKRPSIMNGRKRNVYKLTGQNIMKEYEKLAKNMLNSI